MINRSSNDWQTQCDIYRIAEASILNHWQTLIVIHREYCIGMSGQRREGGIGWQWSDGIDTVGLTKRNGGKNDFVVFMAQVTAFACMWV